MVGLYFETSLYIALTIQPCEKYLMSLKLSFLTYKTGITKTPPSQVLEELNKMDHIKPLGTKTDQEKVLSPGWVVS